MAHLAKRTNHPCVCNVNKFFPPLVPPPLDKNEESDLSESSDTEESDSVAVLVSHNVSTYNILQNWILQNWNGQDRFGRYRIYGPANVLVGTSCPPVSN